MGDLRVDIERIYKYLKDQAAPEAKPPIEILQDIELELNNHMRDIKYIHDQGYEYHLKVKARVEARRAAKQAEAREKINEQDRQAKEEAQAKLKAKENLRVKKFGKPNTSRSAKPRIKQKIVKRQIDPETQDELTYLGLELKEFPDEATAIPEEPHWGPM